MKLKHLYLEMFDTTPADIVLTRHGQGIISHFTIDSTAYIAKFTDINDGKWLFSFSVGEELDKNKKQLDRKGYEITGSGKAPRVFTYILNIIQQFVADVKPKIIYFSSDEKSRTSLYRALLRRMSHLFRDYDESRSSQYGTIFTVEF